MYRRYWIRTRLLASTLHSTMSSLIIRGSCKSCWAPDDMVILTERLRVPKPRSGWESCAHDLPQVASWWAGACLTLTTKSQYYVGLSYTCLGRRILCLQIVRNSNDSQGNSLYCSFGLCLGHVMIILQISPVILPQTCSQSMMSHILQKYLCLTSRG